MASLDHIMLNVSDLERAMDFYVAGLGFTRSPSEDQADGRRARLALGSERLILRQPKNLGKRYPSPRTANDPWFHHFAIAVSDMDRAYRQLTAHSPEPITIGGPQTLPPSTGNVTAYKFRDPDGHPLELSFDPARRREADAPLFLGIDHTALAVADIDRSVAWYRDKLGVGETMRLMNQGPGQDRLDGLPDVRLDIAVLSFGHGPHIELLHYRQPESIRLPLALQPNDIAATVTVIRDLPRSGEICDPDGHIFVTAPDRPA